MSMEINEAIKAASILMESTTIVVLGTNGEDGFPNVRGMLKLENDGLKTIWFSSNTGSKKVSQLERDSRACVYIYDPESFKGLMLVGRIDIFRDENIRRRFWGEGFEPYYPEGVNDPNYSILRFTAEWGNYYSNLSNTTFELP